MKVILRNNDGHTVNGEGVINLPSEVWKPLGLKINDTLHIEPGESTGDNRFIIIFPEKGIK